MDKWSVTLTGELQPQAIAGQVWPQVAEKLKTDPANFQARFLPKLPITLRPTTQDQASKQQQVLQDCGAEAVLLPDSGERYEIKLAVGICGPVSGDYLYQQVKANDWNGEQLARVKGDAHWHALVDMPVVAALLNPTSPKVLMEPTARPDSGPGIKADDMTLQPKAPLPAITGMLPTQADNPGFHAGFWRRFVALFIDRMIIAVVSWVLYFLFLMVGVITAASVGDKAGIFAGISMIVAYLLITIVGQWLYFALCESSRWQATIGKLAMGLRVTNMNGERIGFGRASGRYFGKFISGILLGIGYMLAGWTPRKQALHDMLAQCCVVNKKALEAREQGTLAPGDSIQPSVPGWAIAVVVLGGFFLLLVPIIGILAAIAIPQYQNYIQQATVSTALYSAKPAKKAVEQYVEKTGHVPSNNKQVGLPASGPEHGSKIQSIVIKNGSVIVTLSSDAGDDLAGDHLVLDPYGTRKEIEWRCSSQDISTTYLPPQCKSSK